MNKLLISWIDDDFIATPCYNIYISFYFLIYIFSTSKDINILLQRKIKKKIFFPTLQDKCFKSIIYFSKCPYIYFNNYSYKIIHAKYNKFFSTVKI